MPRRCRDKTKCPYPRTRWWKSAMGVDWYGGGSGGSATEAQWYLIQTPIVVPRMDIPHPADVSHVVSKVYGHGYELGGNGDRIIHGIADNNTGTVPGAQASYDQTFIWRCLKTADPGLAANWSVIKIDGEPQATFKYADHEPWDAGQNWAGSPFVNSLGNLQGYYSANASIALAYSLGKWISSDAMATINRNTNPIIDTTVTGQNRFQFHQSIWDADDNCIYIIGPDRNKPPTQGRSAVMEIWKSNDGEVGEDISLVKSNIFNGTDIDVEGFALMGPLYKHTNGKYRGYACRYPVPNYEANPGGTSFPVYPFISNGICEIECDTSLGDVNHTWSIVEDIFITDQQAQIGIYPASTIWNYNGKQYMLVCTFGWKGESTTASTMQTSINIKMLVKTSNPEEYGQVVGNNIYPSKLKRFYKCHQTHLDDTYQSTTINPIEVLSNRTLDIVNAPQQHGLNRIIPTNGYVRDPLPWTGFNTRRLVIMQSLNSLQQSGAIRGINELVNTVQLSLNNGITPEFWLYGIKADMTLGIKKWRSTAGMSGGNLRDNIWKVDLGYFGFEVLGLNGPQDDLIVNPCFDTTVGFTVTKVQDDKILDIAYNSNLFTIGFATGLSPWKTVGTCLIAEEATWREVLMWDLM